MDAPTAMAHSSVVNFRSKSGAGEPSLVTVVDDDESVRESLPDLLRELGFAARAFTSAEDFLSSDCVKKTRCLILDIAMPGMTGPDLQKQLGLQQQQIPTVYITAHKDERVRLRLLEEGAVECLFKPFSDVSLLQAVRSALQRSSSSRTFVQDPEVE
jgi:FixJ family two-component response regulator